MKRRRRYYLLALVLIFIVGINVLLFVTSPADIVSSIGVKNAYLVVFAIATLGGLSSVSGTAYFASIATFAAGGANPILLGLVGGLGIFISDSIFYFLALQGWRSAPEKWEEKTEKIRRWISKHSKKAVLGLMYAYISFTPLPNDVLMAALVIGGYRYRQIIWVLLAGSLTISLIAAHLGGVLLGWI